jgi:large subunit ribosomal protein L25
MYVVKAESRNADVKVKNLRKEGIVPGCVYGGKLPETLLIQLSAKEATKLLREKTTGGQVSIDVNGKKMIALLKEIGCDPLSGRTEHLSFQGLVADELVTSTAQITLINEASVSDIIRQTLFELSIRALPANLVEEVRIDMTGMSAGAVVRVEDLDIANNADVELLTHLDTMVVTVIDKSSVKDEEAEAEEGAEAGEVETGEEAAETDSEDKE